MRPLVKIDNCTSGSRSDLKLDACNMSNSPSHVRASLEGRLRLERLERPSRPRGRQARPMAHHEYASKVRSPRPARQARLVRPSSQKSAPARASQAHLLYIQAAGRRRDEWREVSACKQIALTIHFWIRWRVSNPQAGCRSLCACIMQRCHAYVGRGRRTDQLPACPPARIPARHFN